MDFSKIIKAQSNGNSIAAMRIVQRKTGCLVKLSKDILPKINVGEEAFPQNDGNEIILGDGIIIFFQNEGNEMVITKATEEVMVATDTQPYKITGSLEYPEIYSSMLGKQIMNFVGKKLKNNKTLKFTKVTYEEDEEIHQKFAIIDLNENEASSDAFLG